ncbi:MAG: glycoside-pentoside-hexuronide (GPH):cation symporter [Lachnospiraceae bacterium]|nr:glycoside-pentoside-hexuronide (GPH):cation symporter [Lachnospiraceae bacterium]
MGKTKRLKEGYHVGGSEKWSYAMFFFGQNIIFALVAQNVHAFFSDIGITAAVVALILLIARLWDAFSDPLIGVIIDKVKFKKGRFLPWIRISIPFITIGCLLVFILPTVVPPALKVLFAIITIILWDISFSLSDIPIYVLPSSMTENIKERSGILGLGRYIAVIGIMLGMTMIPILQGRLGWIGVAVVFAILCLITMLPLCFKAKERYIVRSEKPITIKQMFGFLIRNKYLLLFYGAMFFSLVTNFAQTLNMFFARHNLGNQDMAGILGLITMIPLIIVGAFIPVLLRRVDKYHIYFFALIAMTVMSVVRFLVGYDNLAIFMILTGVQGLISGVNGMLVFMFTPDCLEYGTYHTGVRSEGVAVSIQTFFNKLTASISGPIAMLVIGAFGFVAGEGAVQPDSAVTGIWMSMTLFTSIGTLIAVILLLFYKLREKDIQVMAQYNNGEMSKDEAESLLAKRYGPAASLTEMSITQNP